jgi:6-phosphofructokinase 1
MSPLIKRIAIVTGGGDAPGLNAVIRAVVLAATRLGWECHGIRDGFNGLLAPAQCQGEPVPRLTLHSVHGIGHLGGTILGSTNRGNPMRYPERRGDGSLGEKDRSDQLVGLSANAALTPWSWSAAMARWPLPSACTGKACA